VPPLLALEDPQDSGESIAPLALEDVPPRRIGKLLLVAKKLLAKKLLANKLLAKKLARIPGAPGRLSGALGPLSSSSRRDMAQRLLEAVERDSSLLISSGGFNKVYDIGHRRVLRVSKLALDPAEVIAYQRELGLAEIMGDAGIGPPILWSSVARTPDGSEHVLSIQEHGGPSLHSKLPELVGHRDYCDLVAKQLLRLMCRVAALGFVDADLKPANIVISGGGIYSARALIIDFDPQFMVRTRHKGDAAAATTAMVSFLESHLHLSASGRGAGAAGARCLLEAMHRAVPSVRLDRDAWHRVNSDQAVRHMVRHYFHNDWWRDWPHMEEHRGSEDQKVGPLRFPRSRTPPECGSPGLHMKAAEAWKLASIAAASVHSRSPSPALTLAS
jgi:hypothetical protein